MKKKEKNQLRGFSAKELQKLISEVEKSIVENIRDARSKPAKNVHEIFSLRKRLATLKTFMKQKELVHE